MLNLIVAKTHLGLMVLAINPESISIYSCHVTSYNAIAFKIVETINKLAPSLVLVVAYLTQTEKFSFYSNISYWCSDQSRFGLHLLIPSHTARGGNEQSKQAYLKYPQFWASLLKELLDLHLQSSRSDRS